MKFHSVLKKKWPGEEAEVKDESAFSTWMVQELAPCSCGEKTNAERKSSRRVADANNEAKTKLHDKIKTFYETVIRGVVVGDDIARTPLKWQPIMRSTPSRRRNIFGTLMAPELDLTNPVNHLLDTEVNSYDWSPYFPQMEKISNPVIGVSPRDSTLSEMKYDNTC